MDAAKRGVHFDDPTRSFAKSRSRVESQSHSEALLNSLRPRCCHLLVRDERRKLSRMWRTWWNTGRLLVTHTLPATVSSTLPRSGFTTSPEVEHDVGVFFGYVTEEGFE